jgi:hypothetical protein
MPNAKRSVQDQAFSAVSDGGSAPLHADCAGYADRPREGSLVGIPIKFEGGSAPLRRASDTRVVVHVTFHQTQIVGSLVLRAERGPVVCERVRSIRADGSAFHRSA